MRPFYCRKIWADVADHLQPAFNLSAFKKQIMDSWAEWNGNITCSEETLGGGVQRRGPRQHLAVEENWEWGRSCLPNEALLVFSGLAHLQDAISHFCYYMLSVALSQLHLAKLFPSSNIWYYFYARWTWGSVRLGSQSCLCICCDWVRELFRRQPGCLQNAAFTQRKSCCWSSEPTAVGWNMAPVILTKDLGISMPGGQFWPDNFSYITLMLIYWYSETQTPRRYRTTKNDYTQQRSQRTKVYK